MNHAPSSGARPTDDITESGMDDETAAIDETVLRRFVPLGGIAAQHLRDLIRHADLVELEAGESFGGPDYDATHHTVYLLDGTLDLIADGRPVDRLEGGTDSARFALNRLRTAQVTAFARSRVRLLRLDRAAVSTMLVWVLSSPDDAGETPGAGESDARGWLSRVLRSELFARIPPPNIRHIFRLLQPVRVRAGECVVRQGESGEHYYIVREGRCEVTRSASPDAPPVRLAQLVPGDSFGEEALITGARRNANVAMLGDGILMRLTKHDFIDLIKEPVLDTVTRAEADAMVERGALWLDVRQPEEHAHDGPSGSLNIPLPAIRHRVDEIDRARAYIVCCNSGTRSAAAAFLLNERGFDAHVLAGGFLGVAAEGAADRAGTSRDGEAAPDPIALKRELARAEAAVEEALRLKAQADVARRRLEEQAEALRAAPPPEAPASDAPDPPGAKTGPDAADELERLQVESARASAELLRAQRRRLEIEAALQAVEAEGVHQRERAEAECTRLRAETEARLRQEEEHLRVEYQRAAAAMEKLRRDRVAAQQRYEQERRRLDVEAASTRERMQSEAQRIYHEMQRAKRSMEDTTGQLRAEQKSEEDRLREQTEEKLREERMRLEAEFSRCVREQEGALRKLERIESARRTMEAEAERLSDQIEAASKQRKAENEARLRAEMERIDARAAEAEVALADALRSRDEASAALRGAQERTAREAAANAADAVPHVPQSELDALQARLARAGEQVDAARRARESATLERSRVEEQAAREHALEEELRQQLQQETERWQQEQRARFEAERRAAGKYARRIAEMQGEREAQDRADETTSRELMDDIQEQLRLGNESEAREGGAADSRAEPEAEAPRNTEEEERRGDERIERLRDLRWRFGMGSEPVE